MTLQRNHYEVLGVPRKATTDEIKKKYRELARKFHPDIAKDKVMGQKIFSQINQAYRILGDPDRRAQYDAVLSADTSHHSPSGTANTSNGTAATRPAAQPPSAQDTANVTRLIAEAETAMLQNNIGKVKQICEMVIKTDPRSQKAHGLLGDALASMGKPQDAAASYRQALQIAPSFAIQAKLDRLQGTSTRPTANGNGTSNGMTPKAPPIPPANGTAPTSGVNRTGQNRTDQGRGEKPTGGLFSRLLGRK